MRQLYILLLCLLGPALPALAADDTPTAVISHYTGSSQIGTWGTKKKESYDVAVRFQGPQYEGKTIRSISLPMNTTEGLTGFKLWLASDIAIGEKTFTADICSLDATAADGELTATLPEPYTIGAGGVYVGVSFDVTATSGKALTPLYVTDECSAGGFLIHTSRSLIRWKDQSASRTLPIMAEVSGVAQQAAYAKVDGSLVFEKGKPVTVPLTVYNDGAAGVQSLQFDYKLGSQSGTLSVNLAQPLSNLIGAHGDLTLRLPEIAEAGNYALDIDITKVNGQTNLSPDSHIAATVNVLNKKPLHRAVMEEYTGTWCGWCPRGYVGMLLMNQRHPDEFVGLAYHNGDPMETMRSSKYPSAVSGFPTAALDRVFMTDAYFGETERNMGIESTWQERCNAFANAMPAVTANLSDGKVYVQTNVEFAVASPATKYKLETVLVADGLKGTTDDWIQGSYYTQYTAKDFPEAEFVPFLRSSAVKNLEFDDVVVATSRLIGGLQDIAPVTADNQQEQLTYAFDLAAVRNTAGQAIIQDEGKLRVVALVIDGETGQIVNAAKTNVTVGSGIQSINADALTAPAAIYDAAGRRLHSVTHGLNIVRTADGKTVKVARP